MLDGLNRNMRALRFRKCSLPTKGTLSYPYAHHYLEIPAVDPIMQVFAAVFILLSLLPVAIYIGLCLFTLTLLLLLGLCVVVLVSIPIALALGFILSLILLTNLLLSIFVTFFLVVAYLSYKIVFAGYTDGIGSARLQILEPFHALFSRVQTMMIQNPPKNTAPAAGEGNVDISRSTSLDSTRSIELPCTSQLIRVVATLMQIREQAEHAPASCHGPAIC
ncbi:hypothetical protein LENED_000455 [Lentinula edodes]|uniref:Uncharacterized protein n=1 Tax=Lentinula edodes TaxID=5353 RepID=A0A1Q3DVK5_LENED|nr:hypothetical protein LENED_000455 [Lentinula edodes]